MRARITLLRRLLGNRVVCRVELAFSGFNIAEYGVWVSVLVYAYERGGTTVTAAVAVAQLLPAGLVAPLLARAADRRDPAVALRRGYWLQSSALTATAVFLLAGAPDLLVYAAAIVAASAVTITRPAQAALVPALVASSDELTAINVLSGWVESVSVFAGPALAGLMIALDSPGAAIGTFALCTAGSALLVPRIASTRHLAVLTDAETAVPMDAPETLVAVCKDGRLTSLLALLAAQYLVIGMLDVLLVVFAISILGLGASGAGYLNAAFGAGGVVGSVAALSLIGKRRLTRPLVSAALGWSLVLIALGIWPTVLGAFLLLAAAGSTRSLLDVSGRTMLLRAAPVAMRGRVFGLLEGSSMFGLAVGSLAVPALSAFGGPRTALVTTGLLLSAIALAAGARFRRIDALGADGEAVPVSSVVEFDENSHIPEVAPAGRVVVTAGVAA